MRASAAKARARSTSESFASSRRLNSSTGTNCSSSDSPWSVCISPMSDLHSPIRIGLQRRQGHFSLGSQPLSHHPVEGVIDVEPFVAFGEKRHQHITGYRAPVADDTSPGHL